MDDLKKKKNKNVCKRKIRNKKGFTLIELLAVIIILGVLLLIAVPSISRYIENSRKNTYINTIRSMVNAVSTSVNAMELPYNIGKNEGMIIPFSEINLEKKVSTKSSPYSDWEKEKSYILVVYDGEMYTYYVSALDKTGYSVPLVSEKSLSIDSITTNKTLILNNIISYRDVINAGSDVAFDSDAITIVYEDYDDKENIVKVKAGYPTYESGDVIQLKDGSKWYSIDDSAIGNDRINLISYYSMDTTSSNYGKQNASNPTIRFHRNQQNPASYQTADIYNVAIAIESATQIELVRNGLDLNGAYIKMPENDDISCLSTSCKCCFKNSDSIPFWTASTDGEWVYTVRASGIGRTNTESTNYGIRIIIKDLLKSNIDKLATKSLN